MTNSQKPSWLLVMLLAAVALAAAGCASSPEPSADSAALGPQWVMQGSGAFDQDGERVFYGVGVASGIHNKALLRQSADDRARLEIAKTLEVYVSGLSKDYMASTTAGDMSRSSEEQHVETALKTFTKTTLHGATITDRWVDPADGSMYALCELDLLSLKEALNDYRELDSQLRDYVRENADRMHEELNRMENR
ncbi:MAG TPA: hypothetical protein ACFCUC_00325 [Desulfobacterales bacterium]